MYSGLTNLKKELTTAAADASLPKDRRSLALELLDEISTSLLPGWVPATTPTDGFVDVIPHNVQSSMWTWITLQARWYKDAPKRVWVMSTPPTPSVPKSTEFEFEEGL